MPDLSTKMHQIQFRQTPLGAYSGLPDWQGGAAAPQEPNPVLGASGLNSASSSSLDPLPH